MSVNEKIIGALQTLGLPVEPDVYSGQETSYCVFNYDLLPAQFAGNRPAWYRALVQVHYFCRLEENSIQRRRETINALTDAGFTWPEVVDASDKDIQHFIFECEILTDERTEENG